MIKFDQWYLPDGENHLPDWMARVNKRIHGRLTYQHSKYELAMSFVKDKSLAIDVGAHVGLWSFYMAKDFEKVACFEPMPEHQECWLQNMKHEENAELIKFALGDKDCLVSMKTSPTSSGDTWVDPSAKGTIQQKTLDSFGLKNVGLIKIDCEGYEIKVLEGAIETLLRCNPVVVVEQKGDMIEKYGYKKLAAVDFLKQLGAKVRGSISGDYILSWE